MNVSSSQRPSLRDNFLVKAARNRVIETVATSVAVSVMLLGSSTWNVWTTYQGFKNSVTHQFNLRVNSDQVVYLDEVLTMSARMAASTGDPSWEERYWTFEPQLTQAINEVTSMANEASKADSEQTDAANQVLIGIEEQAFELVRAGQKEEAFQLLLGNEYLKNKQVYSAGIEATIDQVNASIDKKLSDYSQRLLLAVTITVISCLLLMAGWTFILYVVRLDIRQRQKAEQELRVSQLSLQQSNDELELAQQKLAEQATLSQAENVQLEEEVGYLLEIVSNLESGDFSQQAEVSDRVTGLVADMLNQFIDEMSRIIATVNETCRQVSQGNLDVENQAGNTLALVREQVDAVEKIQALMRDINVRSQDTLNQAMISDASLKVALKAVEQGEAEMNAMTTGFMHLRHGTHQITRRVESLNDFVEMAAQFAQAQKRTASLTRVLAYNASMVANRAVDQQDPNQFATVAREFATIATQVNELAMQTNQSLETLDQRTQKIQSAVSGITDDTQDINQLVDQFTQSVEQSSQSFGNLKNATAQMAQLGQQVTQSSEEIALAADNTVQAMDKIRAGGDKTEQQSRITQEQSSRMKQLTQQLLERMDFFQLSEETQTVLQTREAGDPHESASHVLAHSAS